MTAVLGISAWYHDAAAALVVDGRIVAAAQEERFTRRKHDAEFPANAVAYCLAEAGLRASDLDFVGFYEKPFLRFERLLETYLSYAPAGFRSFARAIPLWLRRKLHLPREMRRALGGGYTKRFVFAEHHESHAASAFFPSPFEEAAILTSDGVGEWATTSFGTGRGNRIELTHEVRFPHSFGLLYSAFTHYTGFRVNSGEHKLMGLAPYGVPRFEDVIRSKLVDLRDDGSFRLDLRYFDWCHGLTMTNSRFDRLFGRPPRKPESPLDQFHMDVAASIQAVTEDAMLRAAAHVHRVTGLDDLCLAGGVALNCVGNGRILREGPFRRVWVQPAAGDAGGALGVALLVWHQLLGKERVPNESDAQSGSLLGPAFGPDETRRFLDGAGAVHHHHADERTLLDDVAAAIADGKVVGWMHGRMEFGPRALGARSILGDARSPRMQTTMNLKIKFRESFRPFAPCVLRERAHEYFDLPEGAESPYMLLVAPVREDKRCAPDPASRDLRGIDRLRAPRSVVPAVTHVDGSARVQTVDEARHGRFWRLLRRFEERTGCPVLVNTSFNVRGEPIVCTPRDAWNCFVHTDMDVLVIGDFVMYKAEQTGLAATDRASHLAQFPPD